MTAQEVGAAVGRNPLSILIPCHRVVGATGKLTAKQKQAVAYHYLADLPYTDIAAILGGTTDAARRAAADGIATLRRSYPGAISAKEEHR